MITFNAFLRILVVIQSSKIKFWVWPEDLVCRVSSPGWLSRSSHSPDQSGLETARHLCPLASLENDHLNLKLLYRIIINRAPVHDCLNTGISVTVATSLLTWFNITSTSLSMEDVANPPVLLCEILGRWDCRSCCREPRQWSWLWGSCPPGSVDHWNTMTWQHD